MTQAVHVSDIKMFLDCRQLWEWASKFHNNLEPIKPPHYFVFGSTYHQALAVLRSTGDIGLALRVITETQALMPEREDIDWDTMQAMLVHFEAYRLQFLDTGLVHVDVELDFSLRLDDDFRLEGTWDGVSRGHDGKIYVDEDKTSAAPNLTAYTDIFEPQTRCYSLAGREAFGDEFGGVLTTIHRKKAPTLPRVKQDGELYDQVPDSTFHVVRNWMLQKGFLDPVTLKPKLERYGVMLDTLWNEHREDRFFPRVVIDPNPAELEYTRQWLLNVARDMHGSPSIYVNSSPQKCLSCAFRVPCNELRTGGNWRTVLSLAYKQRVKEAGIWPLWVSE